LQYFLVTEIPGPEWDRSRPRREQLGWDAHAAFVDSLADQGAVVVGGPVGDPDYGPALLVAQPEAKKTSGNTSPMTPRSARSSPSRNIQLWSIWISALPG